MHVTNLPFLLTTERNETGGQRLKNAIQRSTRFLLLAAQQTGGQSCRTRVTVSDKLMHTECSIILVSNNQTSAPLRRR